MRISSFLVDSNYGKSTLDMGKNTWDMGKLLLRGRFSLALWSPGGEAEGTKWLDLLVLIPALFKRVRGVPRAKAAVPFDGKST